MPRVTNTGISAGTVAGHGNWKGWGEARPGDVAGCVWFQRGRGPTPLPCWKRRAPRCATELGVGMIARARDHETGRPPAAATTDPILRDKPSTRYVRHFEVLPAFIPRCIVAAPGPARVRARQFRPRLTCDATLFRWVAGAPLRHTCEHRRVVFQRDDEQACQDSQHRRHGHRHRIAVLHDQDGRQHAAVGATSASPRLRSTRWCLPSNAPD